MKLTIILLALCLLNCDKTESTPYPLEYSNKPRKSVLTFGVHPLHNPNRLYQVFNPLVELINSKLDSHVFILEASKDYADFDKKMKNQHFAISLPNPYQTYVSLSQGYSVFAKMSDDHNFRGIYVTRKDSGIDSIADLKNKTLCYPAPTALAATMMPQFFLYQKGINLKKDVKIKYLGSQESSIMGAFNKTCAVSGTWPPPWTALKKERKELNDSMRVIWQTESLSNNGLVYRKDMDKKVLDVVRTVMLNLQNSNQGKEILGKMELSKFEPADNTTYKSIENYIKEFTQKVRKPKDPL